TRLVGRRAETPHVVRVRKELGRSLDERFVRGEAKQDPPYGGDHALDAAVGERAHERRELAGWNARFTRYRALDFVGNAYGKPGVGSDRKILFALLVRQIFERAKDDILSGNLLQRLT